MNNSVALRWLIFTLFNVIVIISERKHNMLMISISDDNHFSAIQILRHFDKIFVYFQPNEFLRVPVSLKINIYVFIIIQT